MSIGRYNTIEYAHRLERSHTIIKTTYYAYISTGFMAILYFISSMYDSIAFKYYYNIKYIASTRQTEFKTKNILKSIKMKFFRVRNRESKIMLVANLSIKIVSQVKDVKRILDSKPFSKQIVYDSFLSIFTVRRYC